MSSGRAVRKALHKVTWGSQKDGIQLNVTADPKLNDYDNRPHTVVMGVYQVRYPRPFLAQLATTPSITSMLETGHGGSVLMKPAPGGAVILNHKTFIVTPGRKAKLTLDRVDDARFVGIIVGYYGLNATQIARLFAVPIVVKKSGLIVKSASAEPGELKIDMDLGPLKIKHSSRDVSGLDGEVWPNPKQPQGEIEVSDENIQRALVRTQSVNPPAR